VLARRVGRHLRFSVVSTDDGVRVASGVVSTSTEAVPPGRVHALHVEQPLLWRPAGWWRISVNRAGHGGGRRNAESERSLAPVATMEEVLTLLPLLVPDLADQRELLVAGLIGRGDGEDFTTAPRRARWLRPLAWRRTGFRLTDASVLARGGFLHRELTIVPDARMQSVSLRQGPLERLLHVATVHPHVVSGPVSTRLRLVDVARAQQLFNELALTGVGARRVDVSHRWRDVEPQP
jgi:putative membrane protein